jgi:hypothetical protein
LQLLADRILNSLVSFGLNGGSRPQLKPVACFGRLRQSASLRYFFSGIISMKPMSLITLLLLVASIYPGQQKNDGSEIYVTGVRPRKSTAICERVLNFDLDTSHAERSAFIRDVGAGSYKLTLTWFPAGKEEFELAYWRVQLREVLSRENQKEKLGRGLLTDDGPPGDEFPREDLIGILYPSESPKNILEKIHQPNGGYYPISAKRIILVGSFNVIIKVNSFKLSDTNPKQLDSMHVTVELRSTYNNTPNCSRRRNLTPRATSQQVQVKT